LLVAKGVFDGGGVGELDDFAGVVLEVGLGVEAEEEAVAVVEEVVDAAAVEVSGVLLLVPEEVVLEVGDGDAGAVREGAVGEDAEGDGVLTVGGDGVTERLTVEEEGRGGIEDADEGGTAGDEAEGLGEVAGAFEGGGDGEEALYGIAFAAAFKAEEEEDFVLADGAAEGEAVLVAFDDGARIAEAVVGEAIGVEDGVLMVVVSGAVEFVRAGLSNDVDGAAAGAAEFGGVGVGFEAELLDGVDGGADDDAVAIADGVGGTVEEDLVRRSASAADAGEAAEHENDVAFDEGVLLDELAFDGGADAGGFGLEEREFGGDVDGGGGLGEGEGEVEGGGLVDFEADLAADLRLEAGGGDGDGGIRDGVLGGVSDDAGEAGVEGLGGEGGSEAEEGQEPAHGDYPPSVTFCGATPDTMEGPMKAYVYVTLKKTVLDAQGKTVTQALRGMGHTAIADVRQGKYFELTLADGADSEAVRQEIEQIAAEVLANPVIEDYRIEFGS